MLRDQFADARARMAVPPALDLRCSFGILPWPRHSVFEHLCLRQLWPYNEEYHYYRQRNEAAVFLPFNAPPRPGCPEQPGNRQTATIKTGETRTEKHKAMLPLYIDAGEGVTGGDAPPK
jgi:hypothetical protein